MPPYSLVVVDRAGTGYGTVTTASNVRPVWELNGPGTLDFELQTVDAAAALCVPTQREVQVWYDDGVAPRCKWWGPVWRREAQGRTTHVQCKGLLSYTERIQLGPVLTNYLADPDFEDATLAHWTAVGAAKSSDTAVVRAGTRSLKLVSGAEGLDQYAYQQFTVNNSGGTEALEFFVRGRFYLTATGGSPYIGPAYKQRGVYVRTIEGGVTQAERWTPLDNSAPRNEWARIFAPPVSVPAGHTQTIEVRWYSPGGTINWDTATACVEESTGANTVSTYADLNTIVGNVLAYAQNAAKNKTDFHLAGPPGAFGVSRSRQYQFYEHAMVWQHVLQPFVDAGDFDVDVTWSETAPTTRTVQTYAHKGTTPGVTLTLGGNADLSSYTQDGVTTAGAITVLPQSMGAEKTIGTSLPVADDVAYAVDVSANAGVTFDEVISSIPEATLDIMVGQAAAELARRKALVGVPTFLTPADAWWASGAQIGDTITLAGSYGWVGAAGAPLGALRVVSLSLYPEKNLVAVGAQ